MSKELLRTAVTEVIDPKLPYSVWAESLRKACDESDGKLWGIGELVNLGERLYGEKYKGALESTKLSSGTLRTIACVCRKVPSSRRRDNLSFWYHAEVALVKDLAVKDQDRFLKLAEENEWTQSELRQAIRKSFATEQEEGGKGAALGFVLNKWTGDFMRWFGVQLKHTPIDDWSNDRCAAVLRELQPIEDAIKTLRARATPRKESIKATTPHR